jgi:hypothetical protein
MTPEDALQFLVQGASNLISYEDQAKKMYHVRVQEAEVILKETIKSVTKRDEESPSSEC